MRKWGWVVLVWVSSAYGFLGYVPLEKKSSTKNELIDILLSPAPKASYKGRVILWNKEPKPGLWCRSFDTKGDGKPHLIDCYEMKKLVRREHDRNGDGKMDEITTFKADGSVVRHIDARIKGQEDTEETLVKDGKFVVRTLRTKKGKKSTKWAVVSISRSPIYQEDEPKPTGAAASDVAHDTESKLLKALERVRGLRDVLNPFEKLSETDTDYSNYSYNFQIHNDCLDIKPGLAETFHEVIKEGLKCLWKTGGEGKVHAVKIGELLQGTPKPKMTCSFKDGFGARMAVSTVAPEAPTIALNPKLLASAPPQYLNQTLFHELLHPALNVSHTLDVDYTYACGYCCFPKTSKDPKELQEILALTQVSCKICSSRYPDEAQDLEYLNKASDFFPKVFKAHLVVRPMLQAMRNHKGKPEERTARLALIKNMSGLFESPLGLALAKDFGTPENEPEKEALGRVKKFGNRPWQSQYEKATGQLVGAIKSWVDGDDDSAFEFLKEPEFPTSGVDPKFKPDLDNSLNRTRLTIAELLYDSYRTRKMNDRAEEVEKDLLEPLDGQINNR